MDMKRGCHRLPRLGYDFGNDELLREALTHRSAGGRNNERLEFLGDGALNFIIAAELYRRYPRIDEGDLSRLRSQLVREETLAEIAANLNLGEALILGGGERKSGGFRRASILADALEAVIGAIYLDGGFVRCQSTVVDLFAEHLHGLSTVGELKDAKTRLQERLQAAGSPLPAYRILEADGADHAKSFTVVCEIPGVTATRGEGASRRKAEQAAAERALTALDAESQEPRDGDRG